MKLARTISLDKSDANVFPRPSAAGEWAVTGTFAFADCDPAQMDGKNQIAFRDGWLGTESFGRSTFVQVATIAAEQYEETVRRVAAHLFQDYGAPNILAALDAARHEIDDMANLCRHPVGTLLAIEREFTEAGIAERARAITGSEDRSHPRIWSLVEDEPGQEEPHDDGLSAD